MQSAGLNRQCIHTFWWLYVMGVGRNGYFCAVVWCMAMLGVFQGICVYALSTPGPIHTEVPRVPEVPVVPRVPVHVVSMVPVVPVVARVSEVLLGPRVPDVPRVREVPMVP